MTSTRKLKIQIHQLLHGYDEGHRLLAGSIKPDAQSAKSLVALSDLSGQGEAPSPYGYITGYPLPQMDAYALARTWLAPEMPRPGCVWTHTLLIDFSDLAAIGNVALLEFFVRPLSRDDIHSYNRTLVAETSTEYNLQGQLPLNTMFGLLEALYEFPMHSIFVQMQDNMPSDLFATALWLQQWPRLQRNFRFCTWASSDRSRSSEPFDLQFIPHKRSMRGKSRSGNLGYWVNIPDSVPEPQKGWAFAAARDAISGDNSSLLRRFLLRYGAETDAGRAAFKPLVQVWQALETNSRIDLVSAIAAVQEIRPPIVSLLFRIMREAVELVHGGVILPPVSIEFIFQNLSTLGDGLDEAELVSLASTFLRYAPERIWPLFRAETDIERSVAIEAAQLMQPEEALKGSAGDSGLFCAALEANPKLATSSLVWDAPEPIPRSSADLLYKRNIQDADILYAMLEANNPEVSEMGIQLFGQAAVNSAAEYYDRDENRRAYRWLVEAKRFPELLFTAVAQVTLQNVRTLAVIASLVDCRFPSVSKTSDEWVRALSSAKGNLGHLAFGFYAFLLGRALSGASPEPGCLIHFSFDTVHNDLLRSRSTKEGWSILDPLLPELGYLSSWDRAKRVRLAVVNAFIYRSFSPNEFLTITEDEHVFTQLVEIASDSATGRSYLENVSSWAKQSSKIEISRRGRKIEDALYRPRWRYW
ncbi:MAG: hypothetical protein ACLP3B_22355 [Syntrophobacteraceae bacterium]